MAQRSKALHQTLPPNAPWQVRRIRAALVSLLLLTALLAAGILFLKYKLEALRTVVQAEVAARVGAKVEAGAILVNGVRGLRIDGLHMAIGVPQGPQVDFRCPATYLDLDLADLASGRVTLSRVRMDHAVFVVNRPEGAPWIPAGDGGGGMDEVVLPKGLAFRATGEGCRVKIKNVARGSDLELNDLDFDLSRLQDGVDFMGRIAGHVSDNREKPFQVNVRFASQEDFDVRLVSGPIDAADLNRLLPEPEPFVQSGAIRPQVRVSGFPNRAIVLSMEVPFNDVQLRGQPAFLAPATGVLTALASYDVPGRLLTFNSAQASSAQLGGRLQGTISFAQESPELALHLEATQIPADEIIDSVLAGQAAALEDVEVSFAPPYAVALDLTGPTTAPTFTALADVSGGSVKFKSRDAAMPSGSLTFSQLQLAYAPGAALPTGALNITGGTLAHAAYDVKVENISGSLRLDQKSIVLDPIQAQITGNTVVGRVRHDLAAGSTEFSLEGALSNLENTPLGSEIPDVKLAGEVGFRGNGSVTKERLSVDLDVDATRTRFDLEWWLRKPMGIGTSLKAVNITMIPGKSITLTGTAEVNTSTLNAAVEVKHVNSKWRLEAIRIKSDAVDVATLGRCFRIPYTASGGALRNASMDWRREGDPEKGRMITILADIDTIDLLARETTVPIHCADAHLEVVLDDRDLEKRLGLVKVRAKDAAIPPFKVKWLLPLKAEDPELDALYPPDDRVWTIDVGAETVELPPWQGTAFTCLVEDDNDKTVIQRYAATVGSGTLEGNYHQTKTDHTSELYAKWDGVPVSYLLRHLEMPEVLSGTSTGEYRSTADEDDPATTQGTGFFSVRDGRFSADALQAQFSEKMAKSTMQLPPSLKFDELKAGVQMGGDRVETKELLLSAEGIRVTGNGSFITSGDLDYAIAVAITPETALTIPILRDSFNLEGHRLTQSDIQLAFDIKGPIFDPDVKLTGLPGVGDTLVSGAAEVTSETMRIIDFPRQILLDLFKIGGGILGSGRQQRNP